MSNDLPPAPRRSGALAFKADGEWVVACPGDPLYSTVTFGATHMWTSEAGWVAIYSDDEGETA